MRVCRGLIIVMLVLAVVLGTGRTVASAAADMPHRTQAWDMAMKAMASDPSMSGMCDKCIKTEFDKRACIPACVGLQALPPVSDLPRDFVSAPIASAAERHVRGSTAPPDPPPPKLNSLA
jgi:hypothetical protein